MAKFEKGRKKTGGKKKGTVHESTKIMKTVKETVLNAFNDLQSDPVANIKSWGKENPKDFYNIAAKLIPTETVIAGGIEFKGDPFTQIRKNVHPDTEAGPSN